MTGDRKDTLTRAATLGVVAGLRSQLPLALLSLSARRYGTGPAVLRSPAVMTLLVGCAAGEIVVDKLPFTPSRLLPGSLAVRIGVGSLAGAFLCRRSGQATAAGAICGGVSALAGSYAGYHVRRSLVLSTGLPDPLIAVLEDGVATGLGGWATGCSP